MKRIWIQRIGAAVLCAVLLVGCMPGGPAADSTASADPLTGLQQHCRCARRKHRPGRPAYRAAAAVPGAAGGGGGH